eukprot:589057-Pyramimonas_sp.AAC.1
MGLDPAPTPPPTPVEIDPAPTPPPTPAQTEPAVVDFKYQQPDGQKGFVAAELTDADCMQPPTTPPPKKVGQSLEEDKRQIQSEKKADLPDETG